MIKEDRPLIAERVYFNFLKKQITKAEATEFLITLVNNSDNDRIRLKSIEILGKISYYTKDVFKCLENCIISDENPTIRATAANIMAFNYQDVNYPSLKWMIEHETSIHALKTLLDVFKEVNNKKIKILNKHLKNRLSTIYGVVPNETEFLIDLELEVNFFNINYLKIYSTNTISGVISQLKSNYMMCAIVNGHIKALNLSGWGLNKIPQSIGLLTKLKHLILRDNYIKTIPESIGMLTQLSTLDLSNCNLISLPDFLMKLKKLRNFSISRNNNLSSIPKSVYSIADEYYGHKYIWEGVCSNEVGVLGLFEILSGLKLKKIKKEDFTVYKKNASNYKINENGNIIGIYIYHSKYPNLNIIPEQISILRYLEELELPNNKIKKIPYSIGKLSALKRLNLRDNEINFLPGSLRNLKNLNCLKLAGNNINKIPEWIKQKLDDNKCTYDLNGFKRFFFGIPI
ncbi:MAG: leucine-rich repeat domain-containing protein, partial [Candidatus Hermodarchaeota archaeon]